MERCKEKAVLSKGTKLRQQDWTLKRDYKVYRWNLREIIFEVVMAFVLVVVFTWFFYRSILAFLPMCFIGWLYLKQRKLAKVAACRRDLLQQFKECILSVTASLQAGYAVENAFTESLADMRMLYGEKALICSELSWIHRGLILNQTLEELLWDLGRRSHITEIEEFAEIFSIAKRSGGNLPEVIMRSAELIQHRTEADDEIRTLLANKRLEQKIMNVMPFGILLYIEISNPGYFDTLYHNLSGMAIMTVCLGIYLATYYLADKILSKIAGDTAVH